MTDITNTGILKPGNLSTTVYKKRPGTTSFGVEYEYLMASFVVLKLINNRHIEDFEVTSKNIVHEIFDDLAVKVYFRDGTAHSFLFQLKHYSNTKKILLSEFTTDRGPLSLTKYFQSFQKLINTENTTCILYTNKNMCLDESFTLSTLESKIAIRKIDSGDGFDFFNTGSIYHFTIILGKEQLSRSATVVEKDDLNDFFKQFYFCTDQFDVKQLQASINETLANMLQCHITDSFINFMRDSQSIRYILTKQDVVAKLAELVFSPFIKTISNTKCNKRCKILQEAIMKFEMTLVEDCDDGILENMWEYPELNPDVHKVEVKFGLSSKGVSANDDQRTKIFWHSDAIPLIIRVDNLNKARINCGIKLLEDNGLMKKLILLGDVKREDFYKWRVFENLSDLLSLTNDLEALSEFRVCFQKRRSISIKEFGSCDIVSDFKTRELLKMTQDVLYIGDRVARLPEPYIPRYITTPSLEGPVKEESAHEVFTKGVNILYSEPGGGKTTLMVSLANNCPSSHWAVYIKLRSSSTIFKRKPKYETILSDFCLLEDSSSDLTIRFRSAFLKTNKIYIFMDALDELDADCVDFVLDYVKYINERGVHVWLSSREYLKEVISSKLNAQPLYIQRLSKDQEDEYFQKRVKSTDKLPSKYTNNSPLEVFMLSEISLGGETLSQETLVLTKIHKKFFDVKKKTASDCFLQDYEIPALKTCLNSKTFVTLDLNESFTAKFLQRLESEGDKLDIIAKVNRDQVVFTNQSFAEYFACVWLRKNLDKIKWLAEDLFSQRNQNLRLIFDTILAEKSVLHLAVIYQVDEVKNFVGDWDIRDEGGRSALHLMCSYRHECEDVVKILLEKLDILEQDKLLGWNCIDYAVRVENFFILDRILETHDDSSDFDDLFERHDLALLASQLGYPNLLKSCIKRDHNVVDTRVGTEKSSLLHVAVRAKCKTVKSIVEVLTSNGLDMNVKDGRNRTTLQLVLEDCDYVLAKVLIKRGADVNCVTNQKRNMLHHAVATICSTTSIINLLIEKITDLNATDIDGCTALHLASMQGNVDIVRELLDRGLNINAVTYYKKNALHFATSTKTPNIELIKLLIERGVDVNAKAYDGATPLHCASAQGDLTLVETLLEHRADIQCTNIVGRTVLHYAASTDFSNTKMIERLCELGNYVNYLDNDGATPLYLASEVGNYDNAKKLLKLGATLAYTTKRCWNALHYATSAKLPSTKLIQLLIHHNIDINAQDSDGNTPLHLASEQGHDDILELLLEAGANVNFVTTRGQSALHFIKFPEIAVPLMENNIDVSLKNVVGVTALHLACQRRQYDLVKVLLTQTDINGVTGQEKNCLHYASAVCGPNTEVIGLLLKEGVEMRSDKDGVTPLHLAVEYNNNYNVKLLLSEGADIKAKTKRGRTALHYAANTKLINRQLIDLLIDSGIDLIAEDSEGLTAFQLALDYNNSALVEMLLERAVDAGNFDAVERFLSKIDFNQENVNEQDYPLYFAGKEYIESHQPLSMENLILYLKQHIAA